jgi:hypothetical protein
MLYGKKEEISSHFGKNIPVFGSGFREKSRETSLRVV